MSQTELKANKSSIINYCVILHAAENKLLTIRNENSLVLPSFSSFQYERGTVSHLNREIKSQTGLNVTTLRSIFYGAGSENTTERRVYEMEAHEFHNLSIGNGFWLALDRLDSQLDIDSWLLNCLQLWLEDTELNKANFRSPWAKRGWFVKAVNWIEFQLKQPNLIATDAVEQVINCESSCILKIQTASAKVYFKAVSNAFKDEPSKTNLLAEFFPSKLPNLLALDIDNHWLLMEEFAGDILNEVSVLQDWQEALKSFARIQIQALKKVETLLDRGIPDMRLDRLAPQIKLLLAKKSTAQANQQSNLAMIDWGKLYSLIPQFEMMCNELSASGIPQTIVHGDFHAQNIISTNEEYIFFDWSYAAISHPFFDAVYLLEIYTYQLPNIKNAREYLLNAYLEPWTCYLPIKQLKEVYHQALPLTYLFKAIADNRIAETMERECNQLWKQIVPYWLKMLLKYTEANP